MNARRMVCFSAALALAHCDSPRVTPSAQPDARAPASQPAARAPEAPPADRVATRTVLTFFHWIRTDPPAPGEDRGVDHGRLDLTLVVEAHKSPANEPWITLGLLGPSVDITSNRHLRGEGTTATWSAPSGAFNDHRHEPFGGDLRTEEPVRAWLSAQPDQVVELPLGATLQTARLPATGALPASARASAGQFDALVVVVVPMRNRRGGRYLVEVLDMNAQPGGFGQNGVMDHLPTRAEITRLTTWMRDPRGMGAERRPPVAMQPIDRS